jgi:hypothetical protein
MRENGYNPRIYIVAPHYLAWKGKAREREKIRKLTLIPCSRCEFGPHSPFDAGKGTLSSQHIRASIIPVVPTFPVNPPFRSFWLPVFRLSGRSSFAVVLAFSCRPSHGKQNKNGYNPRIYCRTALSSVERQGT